MTTGTVARDKLIHNAAARADKLVFCLLAEQRELGTIDLDLADLFVVGCILFDHVSR